MQAAWGIGGDVNLTLFKDNGFAILRRNVYCKRRAYIYKRRGQRGDDRYVPCAWPRAHAREHHPCVRGVSSGLQRSAADTCHDRGVARMRANTIHEGGVGAACGQRAKTNTCDDAGGFARMRANSIREGGVGRASGQRGTADTCHARGFARMRANTIGQGGVGSVCGQRAKTNTREPATSDDVVRCQFNTWRCCRLPRCWPWQLVC